MLLFRSEGTAEELITITGITAHLLLFRSRSRTANPSVPGRFRSSRINRGHGSLSSVSMRAIKLIACSPSSSTVRSAFSPWAASASLMRNMSVGLSSTTTIETRSGTSFRHGERELRAFSGFRLDPDTSSVALDNPLAYRQTHAGSGVFAAGMQPLEDSKDALLVRGWNPDSIIHDAEYPVTLRS